MTEKATLEELGRRRAALRQQLADVTERLRARALADLEGGKSESEVSREAQVDRMTVRKWLGKR